MERKYIVLEGVRDPSPAIWVQTGSQYIDIRIPHDRPQFRGKRSLNDLGIEELFELARQSADTGVCRIENRLATWNSWADRFGFWCDEADIFPDDGCLEPRRGTIFETETENSGVKYEEAWVLQPYDQGIVAHLTLRPLADPAAVLGVLLVTGRYAGYVERSTSANQASLQRDNMDKVDPKNPLPRPPRPQSPLRPPSPPSPPAPPAPKSPPTEPSP